MSEEKKEPRSVLQDWVQGLPLMQQTVLLTAIRGPDGTPKYTAAKYLLRWLRRCVLLSALDQRVLTSPIEDGGGSFTGPSVGPFKKDEKTGMVIKWEIPMKRMTDDYIQDLDAVPYHYQMHFMHAVEILGHKHPDSRTRSWWYDLYIRLVNDMHLHPESEEELDRRLGDTREGWLERADEATQH